LTSLAPGAEGQSVHELQGRLRRLGFDVDGCEEGRYGDATFGAVQAFQDQRGLPATGWCDSVTWCDLIESGFQPGDRDLGLTSPMLRGDDVLSVQNALSSMGFDVGWIDGIYGTRTDIAVRDFQLNAGIDQTGYCDEETLRRLAVLGGRISQSMTVASIRERERLMAQPPELAGRRILIGHDGSLGPLCHAISRKLRRSGALVQTVDDVDGSQQARFANAFAAEVALSFSVTEHDPSIGFYETDGFRSHGGARLAELLADGVTTGNVTVEPIGRRHSVLRETRMPAVLVETTLDNLDVSEVLTAVMVALTAWVEAPLGNSTAV
jgi:N-acetylmuramoyl-L-alanine amidase